MRIALPAFHHLTLRCTAEFLVYLGAIGHEDKMLIGPDATTARVFRLLPLPLDREVLVETKGQVFHQLVANPDPSDPVDPTPVEIPLKMKQPLSLQEEIKRFVRMELSQQAQDQGAETFEEADDFDVGDEDQAPFSGYQLHQMQAEAGLQPADADLDPPGYPTNAPPPPASPSPSNPVPGASPPPSPPVDKTPAADRPAT